MHILMVHNDYAGRSGEEQAAEALATLLADHGPQVSWFRRSSAESAGSFGGKVKAFFSGIPLGFRWGLGFVIASVLVTALSPPFLSTLRVYQWSDEIEDYVLKEGYVHRNREEGWASTSYGAWGLSRTLNMNDPGTSTVLIWGDSYIEAHQVRDDEKVACQFNRVSSSHVSSGIRAVSIGHSYWSVADYCRLMAAYDKKLHPMCHVIVLAEHGLKDLCPDEDGFRTHPQYEFVHRTLVDPRKNAAIEWLDRWHLADLSLAPWRAVRNTLQDVRGMRFTVGPCEKQSPAPEREFEASTVVGEPNDVLASWTFAIDRLKSATDKPIVLVLIPEVPCLEHGTVKLENPQAQWTARLAELCRIRHIDLIDMTDALVQDYVATGVFSRGFHHGRPGCGHLNARGHLLLARQIRAYLDEHGSAGRDERCSSPK